MTAIENRSFVNELYYIVFLGGTGGNLLAKLLYHIIYSDTKTDDLVITGAAHDDTIFTDRIYSGGLPSHNENAVYSFMEPKNNHTNPMIEYDHNAPEWSNLFAKFPNCKAIVITLTKNEAPRVIGNLFFKTICNSKTEYNEPWEKLKINHSYLKKYQCPDDVPTELIGEYVKEVTASYEDLFIVSPFKSDSEVPKDCKIDTIAYYDLIHNPEKVLLKLAQLTDREIPNQVRSMYQNYIDLQENLVKTKMPWVSDK